MWMSKFGFLVVLPPANNEFSSNESTERTTTAPVTTFRANKQPDLCLTAWHRLSAKNIEEIPGREREWEREGQFNVLAASSRLENWILAMQTVQRTFSEGTQSAAIKKA